VAKKRVGKFPKAFRQMAVDRLTQCDNIVELAKELGISRRLLYTWREKLEPVESGNGPPATNARSVGRQLEWVVRFCPDVLCGRPISSIGS
jgi:transposase-like protein